MILYYLQQIHLIPNLQDPKFIEEIKQKHGRIIYKKELVSNSKVKYVSATNPEMKTYQQQLCTIDIVEVIKNYFEFYNVQRLSEMISISPHILPKEYNKKEINVFAPFVGLFNITEKITFQKQFITYKYQLNIDYFLHSIMFSTELTNDYVVLFFKKLTSVDSPQQLSKTLQQFKPKEIFVLLH
ncbi:hypothetical protein QTN25_005566 [Entamoeba marina]